MNWEAIHRNGASIENISLSFKVCNAAIPRCCSGEGHWEEDRDIGRSCRVVVIVVVAVVDVAGDVAGDCMGSGRNECGPEASMPPKGEGAASIDAT